MKKKITKHVCAMLLLAFGAGNAFAQEEVTYTLDPSELQPADDGYYIGGNFKDENDDGTEEFYNGCYDAYGDANHNESGTQQDFTYGNAMIMPTCDGKGTPPEGFDNNGYIELTKFKYPETDSLTFGFIDSPVLSNLRSLKVRTGTDNSINASRSIFMEIETSLDGGETWLGPSYKQELTNQGGDVFLYEAGGDNASFNAMVAESEKAPLMVRIRTTPPPGADQGERLKIFGMEIQASTADDQGPVTGIEDELDALPFFYIRNHAFVAAQDNLRVYNVMGAMIGRGNTVNIPESGLYIVMSDQGEAKKVFVR